MEMIDLLAAVSDRAPNDNMRSVVAGLEAFGEGAGLDRPHRLAQYVPQIAHESGRFQWDRELWGPTPAQKRYEGRADLGNTQPGDGSKFRGHTAMQITGRTNTGQFTRWCREKVDPGAPDFLADPRKMLTDPWEGLGPVWYWDSRDINRYADAGDIEMVTRRINGGLNGYDDRLALYDRTALLMLGFEPDDVRGFQDAFPSLTTDGISGPRTRGVMHRELVALYDTVDSAPSANDEMAEAQKQLEEAIGRLRQIEQLAKVA